MSSITEAIIYVVGCSEEVQELLTKPFPKDKERNQSFGKISMDKAGGTKCFVTDVYAGSFNYFDEDDLTEWWSYLPFSPDDNIVMLIRYEYSKYTTVLKVGKIY